ncbi:MAG TPA: radical SAM protein [Dehalococcoidia bacterium]|nr:radical SAM protein [Dehalococcoidia bacterium]
MLWVTNMLCNYNCVYCSASCQIFSKDCAETEPQPRRREQPAVGKYSPEHIARCFDSTGKVWKILLMGGGECFLYPQFVELVRALTQIHYVEVATNLSTPNVYQFADVIPSQKVLRVVASLHIMEREKRRNGVEEFIDKVICLQDKGFNVSVQYVVYPPLIPRALKDMEYFTSRGIDSFFFRPFQGIYAGATYPASYTEEEKILLKSRAWDTREIDMMHLNAFGRLCGTGTYSFHMDYMGNLGRCLSSQKRYGNFFTGKYYFDEHPKPCPVRMCTCPLIYQGQISSTKGSASSVMAEMIKEAWIRYPPYHPKVAVDGLRSEFSSRRYRKANTMSIEESTLQIRQRI